ncbi:MAG: YwiC-like family protein [Caldilineales bacterium]|nr:YwiC-like family protein [Caldilineales bacterium]MDW8318296.1 YwiC-like family protein [Anaerolineae bacterium]
MAGSTSRRTLFRKSIVVPTEHGAWSWLLVPWLAGAVVGLAAPARAEQASLALLLTLVGGLSAYMVRQPATAYLRIRQGRGREADRPLALGWMAGFSLLALGCLVGLLLLGRTALLGLAIPFLALLAAYLLAAAAGRAAMRSLGMELAGAAGLALSAPAAYIAASGRLTPTALALWALLALQNVAGVLYVRQRLADTKGQPGHRRLTLAGHGAAFVAVAAAAAVGAVPWLAAVPFAGFLARAVWAVQQPRPIPNVKRFGFMEIGVEILGAALMAAGFS